MTPTPSPNQRLESLDGLRAAAIAMVMLFHYLTRWTPPMHSTSLYPYGSALAGIEPAQHGWLGVQLFFIISGFVITLTLQRCNGLYEFAARRYSRLGPTMLLCSAVTFVVLSASASAPFPTDPVWFISSLTFLDPQDLNDVLGGSRFRALDGVYWSLFVEVKFYVVAGLMYFWFKRGFHVAATLCTVLGTLAYVVRIPLLSSLLDRVLIPVHMPWFVMGIGLYYRYRQAQIAAWIVPVSGATLALAILQVTGRANVPAWAIIVIPAIFVSALDLAPVRRVLSSPPLVAAGAASYSCYLLHQNIGVTVLDALPDTWSSPVLGACLVIGLMTLMCLVSIASFRIIESPINHWLVRKLLPRKTRAR